MAGWEFATSAAKMGGFCEKQKSLFEWVTFSLRKRPILRFMKDNKNNERRFSSCYGNNFAQAQTNERQRIQPKKTYCELAVQHPFFESQQSCVSTKVTLSHRFKSSPAIPGKLAVPGTAGYLMNAGHFRKNHVSSGDLNRPRESRGSQPSISLKHGRLAHVRSQFSLFRRSPTHKNLPLATFCTSERVFGYFLHAAKSNNSFPCREHRGSANLDAVRRNGGFALTKLNPFAATGGIFSYFL